MRTLIIGARGLLGSALKKQLPDALGGIGVETEETGYVYMDITKYETMFKVFSSYRPEIVYLTAAITHVDKCEDFGTSIVNIRGATEVLRLCESFEAKLVYYSSSYVFDGEKKTPYTTLDTPSPVNSYGRQKLTMENLILKSHIPFVIIRTVGVYGMERTKKNFAKQVISGIFKGQTVYAPNDQKMNPILSDDLARISIKLASKYTGLWHVAGDTCMTKFIFAKRVAGYFGLENLVKGISTEEMSQKALRPKNACLDCSELKVEKVPSFDAGLISFLGQEYS